MIGAAGLSWSRRTSLILVQLHFDLAARTSFLPQLHGNGNPCLAENQDTRAHYCMGNDIIEAIR
jgi:hypothetical protein